jgi:hypothetical protein
MEKSARSATVRTVARSGDRQACRAIGGISTGAGGPTHALKPAAPGVDNSRLIATRLIRRIRSFGDLIMRLLRRLSGLIVNDDQTSLGLVSLRRGLNLRLRRARLIRRVFGKSPRQITGAERRNQD